MVKKFLLTAFVLMSGLSSSAQTLILRFLGKASAGRSPHRMVRKQQIISCNGNENRPCSLVC